MSEHEQAIETVRRHLASMARQISGSPLSEGPALAHRALDSLASALAVVEQERDQLREALEAIRKAAVPRKWETRGHPMNDWTKRDPILRLVDAALAVPSSEPMVYAWLIERGQPEQHSPTVWWTGERWSPDPWKAARFATKQEAETKIAEFPPSYLPTAHAVQHGFAVPSSEPAGEPEA